MKRIAIWMFILCASLSAQTVTGSSINFSTASTNKCLDPTKGQLILCGTSAGTVTVSFDGASPVTLPPKGNDGVAATVTIGTVTAGASGTAPKVTNSGTSAAAVLNFTIPVGANGATGATGATGSQGPPGTTTLTNASCSLKFTGAATTDGGVAVTITCQ